jgi:hypothetical protein
LTATRDALVRVVRPEESDAVELYATAGGAEWELAWRGALSAARFGRVALTPPIAIEDMIYRELEEIAKRFAADWVWFAADGREEIAVERERYAQYGYTASMANVRSARLHRMRADAEEGKPLIRSTLGRDELWVRDLVFATWAAKSEDER